MLGLSVQSELATAVWKLHISIHHVFNDQCWEPCKAKFTVKSVPLRLAFILHPKIHLELSANSKNKRLNFRMKRREARSWFPGVCSEPCLVQINQNITCCQHFSRQISSCWWIVTGWPHLTRLIIFMLTLLKCKMDKLSIQKPAHWHWFLKEYAGLPVAP